MKSHILTSLFGLTALFASPLAAEPANFSGEQVTFYNVPIFYHSATLVSPFERIVELEDESRWSVAESDLQTLLTWRHGDFVVLTPDRSWFSDHTYCLTNQANGTYVSVDLFRGPRINGAYSHRVSGMDLGTKYKKAIYLDLQSAWTIHPDDYQQVAKWAIDDSIIFGLNDEWFTAYETLLINVETNAFVRAKKR